jgi:benzoate/toluate 1,2-dioxygenase subunit alpha
LYIEYVFTAFIIFGSPNPDVAPLVEHLGEAAKIIDLIVDQSPEGLEILRGSFDLRV